MNRDSSVEPRNQDREPSRDSKDSGRAVRCGCQYYQTDSLLPERQSLVGTKPVSRPSSRQSQHEPAKSSLAEMGDHEYEPVTPLAVKHPPSPPPVKATEAEVEPKKVKKGRSSKIEYIDNDPNYLLIPLHGSTDEEQEAVVEPEKQYIRIPTAEELVVAQEADADTEDNQDDQEEQDLDDEELSAQEIQNRLEERFFAPTPTTTESRTDCEINTSQIDSSGLEDLPLKREARKAADLTTKGFQQRLRSQAGRLRSKIRNIQKPKISLPDRPKFHLPERPKFNLPDRSKFRLPDRPKINLPDRPKFNLPDRPKFNMPQRPKISMPNFQLGKSKSSSLRRPLRDRNQFSSAQSTAGSKKNIFDSLNFRTYPRFFNKKKRMADQTTVRGGRAMTPPPRMETDSIPSSPGSRKLPLDQKWSQRYRDIKFADDENQSNQSEKQSVSLKAMSSFDDEEPVEDDSAPFRDPDFRAATLLVETKRKVKERSANSLMDSDREQRSSGSSSERHRAGVLEEIDSDEFFLRQKGLSREDVDVSRFLSNEIRDAFRSPHNALARLDTELYDEDDEEICQVNKIAQQHIPLHSTEIQSQQKHYENEEPHPEPIKPSRSRSLRSKRSTQSKSSIDTKDDNNANFNTYPPSRPSRSRKQSMTSSTAEKQSIGSARLREIELETKEGFDEEEARLDVRAPSIPSLDEVDAGILISGRESMNDVWPQEAHPPLPPKRRKSTKDMTQDDNDSMIDETCPEDKWIDEINIQAMMPGEITALQIQPLVATVTPLQHGVYDSPPVVPIRKTRSIGTSLADEDRTSRGAESLVSETQSYPVDDIPPEAQELQKLQQQREPKEDMFGYAIVEKPEKHIEKPERHKRNKPPRPPPPNRKKRATTQMLNIKNQGIQFFFTYPRRAMKSLQKHPPIRPLRNYSTIAQTATLPSRPPRRTKVFREPVYADGDSIRFMDESEKETLDSSTPKVENQPDEIISKQEHIIRDESREKSIDDTKDLHSGDVVEKMKGRPLPAPPRPSRKSKGELQLQGDIENMTTADDDITNDEVVVTERLNIVITPTREILGIVTDTEIEKKSNAFTPIEPVAEIKEEVEKKEGTLATLKGMISQKKKEFFEPKKETKQTIKTETVVTKVERKLNEAPLFQIIPLRSTEETDKIEIEETNVSTQTDPLPDEYVVEDERQPDEFIKSRSKTPEIVVSKPEPEIKTELCVPQEQPIRVEEIHTVIEKRVVVMPDPDTEVSFLKAQKLQVSELDVDKLNVTELQAKKISVSDIDGVSMQLSELSSKSGNLILNGVELPPDFLRNLMSAAVQSSETSAVVHEHESTQTSTIPERILESTPTTTSAIPESTASKPQTNQQPPVVVYPSNTPIVVYPPQTNAQGQSTIAIHPALIPQIYNPDYAIPASIPRTRSPPRSLSPEDTSPEQPEEDLTSLVPVRPRRHQHSPDLPIDKDSEEITLSRRQLQIEQHTAAQLVRQLLQIWQNTLTDGIVRAVDGINRVFPEGEKRKDAQTAVCIVLVLIAGLILLGFGTSDKAVHHHHWDFQFPPPH